MPVLQNVFVCNGACVTIESAPLIRSALTSIWDLLRLCRHVRCRRCTILTQLGTHNAQARRGFAGGFHLLAARTTDAASVPMRALGKVLYKSARQRCRRACCCGRKRASECRASDAAPSERGQQARNGRGGPQSQAALRACRPDMARTLKADHPFHGPAEPTLGSASRSATDGNGNERGSACAHCECKQTSAQPLLPTVGSRQPSAAQIGRPARPPHYTTWPSEVQFWQRQKWRPSFVCFVPSHSNALLYKWHQMNFASSTSRSFQ